MGCASSVNNEVGVSPSKKKNAIKPVEETNTSIPAKLSVEVKTEPRGFNLEHGKIPR